MNPPTIQYIWGEQARIVPKITEALTDAKMVYVDGISYNRLRVFVTCHGYSVGRDAGRVYVFRRDQRRYAYNLKNRMKRGIYAKTPR